MNFDKFFLLERGTKTGNVWVVHRAKRYPTLKKKLSRMMREWEGEREFAIVKANRGVWAKRVIYYENLSPIDTSVFGKLIYSVGKRK